VFPALNVFSRSGRRAGLVEKLESRMPPPLFSAMVLLRKVTAFVWSSLDLLEA
jgi:hypothetical protein